MKPFKRFVHACRPDHAASAHLSVVLSPWRDMPVELSHEDLRELIGKLVKIANTWDEEAR